MSASMRKLRNFLVAVVISFSILYLPFTQRELAEILNVEEVLQPSEAIVVLGGGLKRDGTLGVSTKERVSYGVFLFKQGLGKYLILSGGDRVAGKIEAEEMYEIALDKGVATEVMIKEAKSSNTYENAVYTKRVLRQRGIKGEIILVTSPYHMRRALCCFKEQGFKVLPAPVKESEIYRFGFYQNLRNIRLLLHEFLGLAYYYCLGRI